MPKYFLVAWAITMSVAGCTKVPENGAMLSATVTVGIQRMEGQTETMITALADGERAILDERWEEIYKSSESKYRTQNSLTVDGELSQNQRIEVATIAASSREQILGHIAAKETELKAQAQENAKHVIDANHAVQDYLLSLQVLDAARVRAEETIAEVSGTDVDTLMKTSKRAMKDLP